MSTHVLKILLKSPALEKNVCKYEQNKATHENIKSKSLFPILLKVA